MDILYPLLKVIFMIVYALPSLIDLLEAEKFLKTNTIRGGSKLRFKKVPCSGQVPFQRRFHFGQDFLHLRDGTSYTRSMTLLVAVWKGC